MFESIFAKGFDFGTVSISLSVALGCGILTAAAYRIKNGGYSKNLLTALVLLPVIVMAVVMSVNRYAGIGAGVAVAGAFALIRFRSAPANARDLSCVFLAMAAGVAAGVGQIFFAMMFCAAVCAIFVVFKFLPLDRKRELYERELRVTVPDDLNFETEFGEIFEKYTAFVQINSIKTGKLGSVFVLKYKIRLRALNTEKNLIDDLRVKNGNLPIVCGRPVESLSGEEL